MPAPIYDGNWRLLEHHPSRGVSVWVLTEGEKTTVKVVAESPNGIVEVNALEQRVNNRKAKTVGGSYRKVASVAASSPQGLYLHQAILDRDKTAFKRWMNDPDNKKWRVSTETV